MRNLSGGRKDWSVCALAVKPTSSTIEISTLEDQRSFPVLSVMTITHRHLLSLRKGRQEGVTPYKGRGIGRATNQRQAETSEMPSQKHNPNLVRANWRHPNNPGEKEKWGPTGGPGRS